MTFVIVLSVVICAGAVAYIASLFISDHHILTRGRDVRARVEEARHLGANENGAVTLAYRLSWREGAATKRVEGRETIPARHAPRVRVGDEVDIKYLDDNHILFMFDK